MEAVLKYLNVAHPTAIVDAMCPGPQTLRDCYGIDAIPMLWYQRHERRTSGLVTAGLKILGRAIDTFRTARWVRGHDVVIVPGAGVLEASLPLWPWGMPYAMFVLAAAGKVFRTRVAFVSVGAGVINKKLTCWLSNSAARLAFYRSYRDAGALAAMRHRQLDTTHDHVYTDLAFALPAPHTPEPQHNNAHVVGVGVMAYFGSNDERRFANEISGRYVASMTSFVEWLVDAGHAVRLFVGDTNGSDDDVAREILASLRRSRPDLDDSLAVVEPVVTFSDVMAAMDRCGSIVAMRYHNLVAALRIAKPTISISYSPKHDVLMERMGLGDFCISVAALDAAQLGKLFIDLQSRSAELTQVLLLHRAANDQLVHAQFDELTAVVFPPAGSAGAVATQQCDEPT
jgi:polysaccharide pyruvyl transferase WcaK-like protein